MSCSVGKESDSIPNKHLVRGDQKPRNPKKQTRPDPKIGQKNPTPKNPKPEISDS